MSAMSALSGLADMLKAEADAVSAFVFLLGEEQSALKQGDADALPAIIERKAAATATLGPLSASRNALLETLGLGHDRAGIEEWLVRHPQDITARNHWQRLQDLAAEARELNRLNGELIHLRMGHNAQMLEALRAANRQDLYGADGQTTLGTPRRVIDSA